MREHETLTFDLTDDDLSFAIGTVAVSGGAVYVWLHKATD